jgi:DNA-binding CsgD family transcriptional regulator
MSDDRTARLTESQRVYLRLVLAHRSSKEIAQELDISAHTVDKRIKEAMRILGVGTRFEAARILASEEALEPGRQLGPQPPDLATNPDFAAGHAAATEGTASGTERSDPTASEAREHDRAPFPLPFPLFARSRRPLSAWQRAGWMIGLVIGLAMATGILLSGLIAASALFNSPMR